MRKLLFTLSIGVCVNATAADWPQFRGPAAGTSTEKNLPVQWSKTENIAWKAPLPGRGVSSPIVVKDTVILTCSSGTRDDQLHTLAFDAKTGKELWRRTLQATGSTIAHPKSCMAAPTPVGNADGVYCLFATGDLAAYSLDGTLLWYRSFCGDYPTITNQVGMAASPILANGKLIVPMDNSGESFLAAIDTKTGKNLWKTARSKDITWVTPITRVINGKTEILFQSSKELVAYDADTGNKVWSSPQGTSGIATPTLVDDWIILPCKGELVAGKLATGGPEQVWKSPKFSTGNSSPLMYDGYVYAASPNGTVTCAEAKTGNIKWTERVKGPFSAAPIGADGKLYLVNDLGLTTIMKAGPETEVLGTADLGEEVMGTPAISNGKFFIRTDKAIYCVGK